MKNKFLSKALAAGLVLTFFSTMLFSKDDKISFYLYSNRIFSSTDAVTLNLNGNGIANAKMNFKLYKIDTPVEFFLSQENPHSPEAKDLKKMKLMADWEYKTKPARNSYYYSYEDVKVPVKEAGVYLVSVNYKNKEAFAYVIVSDFAMILKNDKSDLLAFVVDRKTGIRQPDFSLSMKLPNKKIIESKTDKNGLAFFNIDNLNSPPFIIGYNGNNFIISETYLYGTQSESLIYLHTDRPVYRPSQTMNYRAIVRSIDKNGEYVTPQKGDSATVVIMNSRYEKVKQDTVILSDFGTFTGSFAISDEPPLGDYQIIVQYKGNYGYFNFSIEEYKKPEYEVSVTLDKKEYTLGDSIKAKVQAKYYFGSPVANATVEYSVYRNYYWRPWWRNSEWAYLYEDDDSEPRWYGGGSRAVATGSGKLNEDGTFDFVFDTKTDKENQHDYTYQIVANVTDASRREISGATSANVTRAEFFITTNTDKYVYKPDEFVKLNVDIKKFDADKPVQTSFTVKVQRYWWSGKNYKENRESVWEGKGSTNQNGIGNVSFKTDKAGYYYVVTEATDSRGRVVTNTSYLYVAESGYSDWFYPSNSGMKIIPDKEVYSPGEVMSALVIMPQAGTDVLVTAEGFGIYNKQVVSISSTTAIIRIPITEGMMPNFYVNISSVAQDQMQNMSQRIAVIPKNKVLKLELITDKKQYKPGESGTVTIKATNESGEPAPMMDIAVGIVDEAIYAIKPDKTPEIQKAFYGNRYNRVQTAFSLNFYFYGSSRDAAATSSADALAPEASRGGARVGRAMNKAMKMEDKEMAGALDDEKLVSPTIRKDFKDIMLWLPSVRTDKNGFAKVQVKFPDNLTTWRLTARGITQKAEVSQSVIKTVARKELLVRMETPRFITQGDELLVAVNVHNYLLTDKQVKLQFSGENLKIADKEKAIKVIADGEQRYDLKISPIKTGVAKLTVKALTNEESDAMELSIPILPKGLKISRSGFAELTEKKQTKQIATLIPQMTDVQSRAITVGLAPSLASTLLGALEDLIGYPYGCVEQTMSRFLPTVIVGNVLKKIDIPFDAKKREELPKMVAQGTKRLYELQHSDGGWGWWNNDETDPFMTAYVIYGLTLTRQAGFEVDMQKYATGINALRAMLEKNNYKTNDWHKHDATTTAYLCYVASILDRDELDNAVLQKALDISKNKDINSYSKSLLAMALKNLGNQQAAQTLVNSLEKEAEINGQKASWKGKTWHYNWQDDEVETSASVLKSLLSCNGNKEIISKGVNYLISKRHGNSWYNTRQTAMVCYALADYVTESKELNPDYNVTVKCNGKIVATKTMTKSDVYKEHFKIEIPNEIIKEGNNEISVEKTGEGKLYVTQLTSYYAIGSAIQPANNGFKVTRDYYLLNRKVQKGNIIYTKEKFNGTIKSGEDLLVKVKIKADNDCEYIMVEDPIPAGCEVVKDNWLYNIQDENGYGSYENSIGRYGRIWNWWYADRDIRDEKVTFFARSLSEKNNYEFTYILHAQIPGYFSAMPTTAALMYYPEVMGNADIKEFNIVP